MAGFNRLIMIGNLTRDPEYKQLTSGQAVCRLGLATNRQFKNRQTGSMVQEVCYIDVDVWGAQAESCKQYLQQGRSVLIEGRLKYDTWEDPNGQKRSKHSIVADRVVFLSSGVATELGEQDGATSSALDLNNPKEKELFDQIEQIKGRSKAAKSTQAPKGAVSAKTKNDNGFGGVTPTGEISYTDEPPFKDDLPF
ncbi:MAG: single-stranded DNA-binding protein [Candidatus Babeliales bacterium]